MEYVIQPGGRALAQTGNALYNRQTVGGPQPARFQDLAEKRGRFIKMEIPSNEFRIKNRAVQETRDSGKKPATAKGDAAPSASAGSEQIALSSKAKVIQKAHEVIRNSADIRTEKVNAIKEKVQNQEYHVSSDVLAEAVLQEIISESQFTDL